MAPATPRACFNAHPLPLPRVPRRSLGARDSICLRATNGSEESDKLTSPTGSWEGVYPRCEAEDTCPTISLKEPKAISLAMPKARKGRGSLVPLKFQVQLVLSTLANDTALLVSTTAALEQGFDIITTHMTASIRSGTPGEGPIEFGIAAGQAYNAAEIVEALDASPLRNSGVEMERSQRKVRLMGTFDGISATETVNEGIPIKKKMFMRGLIGQTPSQAWIVNRSGAALTTGTIVEFSGTHWGRWK